MDGYKISNVLHHLKIIIDSHIAFIRVFQVDLKPVFAGGGESVDIFQANHSFTCRNCVLMIVREGVQKKRFFWDFVPNYG